MSAIIGTVARITGRFSIKRADGSTSELSKNDEIYEGDLVSGSIDSSQLNSLVVNMVDGVEIVMLGDESQLFDSSLLQGEFAENETVIDVESIEAMVNDSDYIENSEDDIDDIDTEAGDEDAVSSSTDTPMTDFAQGDDNSININAELRDVDIDEEEFTLNHDYELGIGNKLDGKSLNSEVAVDINEAPTIDATNDGNVGAQSGQEVVGLYYNGSDVNILDSIDDPLFTTSNHYYFDHDSLGVTGYNYMGDASNSGNDQGNNDWFVEHGINVSKLRGGSIEFADGTTGDVQAASNGIKRDRDGDGDNDYTESSYIYYNTDEVPITTNEDTPIELDVLANDIGADGDTLSIVDVNTSSRTHGTVEIIDGKIVFTPDANYNGQATFDYTVSDGKGTTDTATVNINVAPVADAPIANDDNRVVIDTDADYGDIIAGASSGVTVTGIYAEGSMENMLDGKPELNTLNDYRFVGENGDRGYNYVGGHDYFEENGISLRNMSGGLVTFSDGTVGIIDSASNGVERDRDGDGEIDYEENAYIYYKSYENLDMSDLSISVNEDSSIIIDVLANDTDADGDVLTVTDVNATANTHGTVNLDIDGNIVFTPEANYNGEASFIYTISDGEGGIDTATVTFNVESVNDAPVITDTQVLSMTEDSLEGFTGYGAAWAGDVYSVVTQADMLSHLNISDVDSSEFTVTLANSEHQWHGGLEANDSTFTSATDALSPASNRYDESVIQITQDFLDNYPTVDAQVGDFYFDHVDFDKLADGEIANISFSVVVSDGEASSEPREVNIEVIGSNDAPVATYDIAEAISYEIPEGGLIVSSDESATVVTGEIVPEGDKLSSVDHWTFIHNGGPLTIDTLSESGDEFIDIDGDGEKDHIDTMMRLYDSEGNHIAVNDDSKLGTEDGSKNDHYRHIQDSYINLDDLPTGEYTLSIGSWDLSEEEVQNDQNDNVRFREQDIGPYQISFIGDVSFNHYDNLLASEDNSLTINSSELLANDSDIDGDSLSIIGVVATQNTHGSVIIDINGDLVFTPHANYNGEASFEYTISDGHGGSDTATVTLNVQSDGNNTEVISTSMKTQGADSIILGDGDDTIDGLAGNDYIDAGAGNDTIVFDSNDTVDGGEGLDTLLVAEDMEIDFSGLAGNISNIEIIDLGDGAQNIISLSVDDVLDMTDTDNLLRIDGDSTDSINLNTQGADAEWTLGDFKTDVETGQNYQEYTSGEGDITVTLEISTDIEINES